MKIRLEFDSADVRDMLDTHFKSNGFLVKNLDYLVQQFEEAYPEGLLVDADFMPEPEPAALSIAPEPEKNLEPEPTEPSETVDNVLTFSEIMSGDKVLADDRTTDEIRHILSTSDELKSKKIR